MSSHALAICLLWPSMLAAAAEAPPAYERRLVAPGEVLALGDGALETALDGGLVRPLAGPFKAPAPRVHRLALTSLL
jgi:hypothetical protein